MQTLSYPGTVSEQGALPPGVAGLQVKATLSLQSRPWRWGRLALPSACLPALATQLLSPHAWDSEATVSCSNMPFLPLPPVSAYPPLMSGSNSLPPCLSLGTCPSTAHLQANGPWQGLCQMAGGSMEPGGGEKSWILGSEGSAARLLCHTLNDLLRKPLNVCEPRLPDGTLVAHVVIRTHRGCCGSIPLRRFSEGPSIRLVIINNFTALASGPMVAPC